MFKVLAVTPLYLPVMGGIEIVVDSIAQALRIHGFETVVVTDRASGLPPVDVINDVRIYRYELARSLRSGVTREPLEILRDVTALVAREQPDIIHLHSVTQASAFYFDRLLRKLKVPLPLVVTQHGVLEPVDQIGVTRTLLLRATILTAVSNAALRSALNFSGRSEASTVVPNGIAFREAAPRQMPARHHLLCVGRLQREKGFDLAIEALARLRDQGLDATLSLIGRGEDHAHFAALAETLGVADHVHFLGAVDQDSARRAIEACSLLLVPSRTREGFSLVAAEAAMAGTPCIASDTGGLPETVEDGITGIIIRSDDTNGLADAIARLLNDPHQWRTMSASAVRRAADRFNIERCAAAYADMYNTLISDN